MTKLGLMLRLYRAVHGQSVRDVAKEMDVSYSTVHRIERETGSVTVPIFLRLIGWLMSPATTTPPPEIDEPAAETETNGAHGVKHHIG